MLPSWAEKVTSTSSRKNVLQEQLLRVHNRVTEVVEQLTPCQVNVVIQDKKKYARKETRGWNNRMDVVVIYSENVFPRFCDGLYLYQKRRAIESN